MRCVGYIRKSSCLVDERCRYHSSSGKSGYYDFTRDLMEQQEEHVLSYAAKIGMKITEIYRDGEGNGAFERLKKEGLGRKIDCVVTDSLYRFGRDLPSGACLLSEVFYPAGIQFAVAEDDFYSEGKTRRDIEEYICEKKSYLAGEYSWIRQRQAEREGILTTKQCRYGYRLNEEHTGLVVEEREAAAVREMYRLYLETGSQKKVSDAVAAAGYPLPKSGAWNPRIVMRILTNPVYKGEAAHVVDGAETTLYTEPIVTDEVFGAVQKKYEESRRTHQRNASGGTTPVNFLNGRIHDKESGVGLCCTADGDRRVFVKKKGHRYLTKEEAKTAIPSDILSLMVKEALRLEKERAAAVLSNLDAGMGADKKKALLKPYRERAAELIAETDSLCFKGMEGKDTAERLEKEFVALMDEAEVIETAYSRRNPWIRLYKDVEVPDELERKHIKKWIRDVLVSDMQTVEILMNEEEFREMLPAGWYGPYVFQVDDFKERML